MKKIKVIFPDGSTAEINESELADAIKAGAKVSTEKASKKVAMAFPDGSTADVDEADVSGAMSAGAVKKKEETTSSVPLSTSPVESGVSTEPIPQSQSPLPSSQEGITGIAAKGLAAATQGVRTSPNIFAEEAPATIFDSPFLDRDVERQFDLSLSKPTKPANKYSLSNTLFQKRNETFEANKRATLSGIKKDKDSLLAYNTQRSTEIDTDVNTATNRLKELTSSISESMSADEMTSVANEMEEQKRIIASGQEYKGKLRTAIAIEAVKKIVPDVADFTKEFNAQAIGREILKVSDPEMDLQFQDATKDGGVLPPVTAANLERLGLDVAKDYLSKQEQTESVKRRLQLIDEMDKSFDQRNIQVTAQRVREKLGVHFYNEGKSGVFGYKDKDIEKAINDPATGLTDNERKVALEYVLPLERKMTLSTDIPGSGFFRSGKNAIERSLLGAGATIAGVFGERTDAMRAYENLNAEIAQGRFRAPGDNPSMQAELLQLNTKEKATGLTDLEKERRDELKRLVNVRDGFDTLRDGIGDLTGQVLQMALLTKGIGSVGKVATNIAQRGGVLTGGMTSSAVGTALSNETTGLFLNSFLQSYDNYRSQALQVLPGDKNIENRQWYAGTMAAIEGFSERIFNDVKVIDAFSKGIAPSVADITSRLLSNKITSQVAREELSSAFVKYAKPFGKEYMKSTFQEASEEAIVDLASGVAESIYGGQPYDVNVTGAKAVETFLTTALYSPLIAGMAAHGGVKTRATENAFYKSAIVDMALNPASYIQSIEKLQLNNTITQEEANEKIKLVNSANNYLREIPSSFLTVKKGEEGTSLVEVTLDYPQSASYLVQRLNEGILADKLEKDGKNDPVLKAQGEASIGRSQQIRQGIVDGTVGVTTNMVPVTDDEKLARELGIAHVNDVNPDDLIGTKYISQPKTETNVKEISNTGEANSTAQEQAGTEAVNIGAQSTRQQQGQDENGQQQTQVLTTKEGAVESAAPSVIKKSVLERPEEEVTIDDILNEITGLSGDEDISTAVKSGDAKAIGNYVSKAKGVIEKLYPKAKLEVFDTTKDYEDAGATRGSRGFSIYDKNGEHKVMLNLEAMSESGSPKTAFHEAIHPIVYDRYGVNTDALKKTWNQISDQMKGVKGMDKVFGHIENYAASKHAPEGITELLTQVAEGNIDIKDIPAEKQNRIIELINSLFEQLGMDFRIKSESDFLKFATEIKAAFETTNVEGLKETLKGKRADKYFSEYEKAIANEVDPVRIKQLNDLLDRKIKAETDAGRLSKEDADAIYKRVNRAPVLAKPKVRVTAEQLKAAQPEKETVDKLARQKSNRQEKINNLSDRVDSFNKMPKNARNKAAALNEIRLDAEELNLTVDYGKGFAILKYEGGGKIQRRSAVTNAKRAKNFDPSIYSQTTQDAVNRIVAEPALLVGMALVGEDGYRFSDAQRESAIESIKEGRPTEGARALYEFFEQAKDGDIILEDLVTGNEVIVSIENYFAVTENKEANADDDIDALNTQLGEESFNDIFDTLFDDFTTNQNEPETIPAERVNPPGKTEQTTETNAEQNKKGAGDTGSSTDTNKASKKAAENKVDKTLTEKGRILADKIRSLKSNRDVLQTNIFGIGVSLYNTSIDIVAYAVEQGARLTDAISRGVEYIKSNYGEPLNEEEYRNHLDSGQGLKVKTKKELTDQINHIDEYYSERQTGTAQPRFIDYRLLIDQSDLSQDELREAVKESKIESRDKKRLYENISGRGKRIADTIRGFKSPIDIAQANIFGIPIAIYDGAIETIATAIEKGAELAQAIQDGIKYIMDKEEYGLQEEAFVKHIEDFSEGKKPVITTTGETQWFDLPKIETDISDDVVQIAKDIRADKILYPEAIAGKTQKFITSLDKELYGSARFSMDQDAFRESIRKQRDFGLSKADVIANLASAKKITNKQQDIIDEVFLENEANDKAVEELQEAMRNLAKGIKPKKVLERLSASSVTSLVKALKDHLSYAAVSNKQLEDIVDYILDTIDVNDIQDYIEKMYSSNLSDAVQLLRAKAIVELQKAGNNVLAKKLVSDMADDGVSAGRQTQSLRRAYEILQAKGNPAVRTEFARRFAEKVRQTAFRMNQRMSQVIQNKNLEIKKLNEQIHQKVKNSPGLLDKLKAILNNICGVRTKK